LKGVVLLAKQEMSKLHEVRENEVAFCADVKSWADALFASRPDWPFTHAKIEQYGTGNYKRSDLRIFRKGSQTPVLAGEVKLPGTPEGRSPYDPALMQDAFTKADNIQAPYFFTWNVNTFVLFDRSKWNVPMIERRLQDWQLGFNLTSPGECNRPDIRAAIRDKFLPELFGMLADIVEGKVVEWGKPPDDVFISSLESHLEWPVFGTRDYLIAASAKNTAFSATLQSWMAEEMNWTFDPGDANNWSETVERAARTLCYIFCNRAIFYEAIRAKYPNDLNRLKMPRRGHGERPSIYDHFRAQFKRAVTETGDYEPIFYPQVNDWAGALIFSSEMACEGWTGLFTNLAQYNFREIPYDIIGGIFQKLISPEERQKFGQFYTNEDIVDIINAFCIRRAGDIAIDPSCGSGSFLVRAYHRKAWLSEQKSGGRRTQDARKSHQDLLREIYGCDIALFAAHLATLNLASRYIEDEENYPYIARANFFEIPDRREKFSVVPGLRNEKGEKEMIDVALPDVDTVIGNPPYVRQEGIPKENSLMRQKGETTEAYEARRKTTKDYFHELCKGLWPGLKLSGRSDLHCYFWPVAASFLKEGGHFGFLTSSSWLDVDYGFALQGWILKNFKLIAVIESLDEPWFKDARVKTCITILQRCDDLKGRMENVVRFVRLFKPVKEILGDRPPGDEAARQNAAEALRNIILQTDAAFSSDKMRIMPVTQQELWDEGVRAGTLLNGERLADSASEDEEDNGSTLKEAAAMYRIGSDYVAGKRGRFLRAPDLYFRLLRNYRAGFVRLGEIADVKFGLKSGCDAFFMPRDVTDDVVANVNGGMAWNQVGLMVPCKRSEVDYGKVRIVRAGDNTLHPIETEYLRPEIHSLMQVDRPVIRAVDSDRVVLWVNKSLTELGNTYAGKYIRWGTKQTFPSRKSKSVPVPQRSTCASRPVWYDLTTNTNGVAFWPMTQKYRHIVAANPDGIVCNHRLFYVSPRNLSDTEAQILPAILNSTLVALVKHFYGRYAGTEGTLDTEIIDCLLLDVPNPKRLTSDLFTRMSNAFESMCKRSVTHLVGDKMLQCHSHTDLREILRGPVELPREFSQEDRHELDDCVFELIGVKGKKQRKILIAELYLVTTEYYRYLRTQDVQAMENRGGNNALRFDAQDLAESIWQSFSASEQGPAVTEWIGSAYAERETVKIPDGAPEALGASDMFNPEGVVFKGNKETHHITYANSEQAALVAALAGVGIRGSMEVPTSVAACRQCLEELRNRIKRAEEKFTELAASRTGTQSLQEKTSTLLLHWYIHGRNS
jgi:hypothetical protein